MTTEYRVRLDRDACEGIFACLVRDDRFVEAEDGLATIERAEPTPDPESAGDAPAEDPEAEAAGAVTDGGVVTATFADDRLDEARGAAAACPVDAIDVEVLDG